MLWEIIAFLSINREIKNALSLNCEKLKITSHVNHNSFFVINNKNAVKYRVRFIIHILFMGEEICGVSITCCDVFFFSLWFMNYVSADIRVINELVLYYKYMFYVSTSDIWWFVDRIFPLCIFSVFTYICVYLKNCFCLLFVQG